MAFKNSPKCLMCGRAMAGRGLRQNEKADTPVCYICSKWMKGRRSNNGGRL